jgi:DNA-3-methyladenine glycosylase
LRQSAQRLERIDFSGATDRIARRLLGCVIYHRSGGELRRGRIVEVEAYTDDAASHSANRKRTPRNGIMFGPPGFAYVYFTYGMHHCVNVVSERDGVPGAVLIRGLDQIEHAAGPGLACRALGLSLSDNGRDLTTDTDLWIEAGRRQRGERIIQTTRIGIRHAADLPRRYYVLGSSGVSKRDRLAEAALASGSTRP